MGQTLVFIGLESLGKGLNAVLGASLGAAAPNSFTAASVIRSFTALGAQAQHVVKFKC